MEKSALNKDLIKAWGTLSRDRSIFRGNVNIMSLIGIGSGRQGGDF